MQFDLTHHKVQVLTFLMMYYTCRNTFDTLLCLQLKKEVQPVCLPKKDLSGTDIGEGITTGWGSTDREYNYCLNLKNNSYLV